MRNFILTKKTTSGSRRIVNRFIPLVKFLGAFLGDHCEVVLHDVVRRSDSVLAIANSEKISGRKIGAPLTDLALKFVMEREHEKRDWAMGYATKTHDGRPLHSATYFIRDDNGELAGMLCLNMDVSDLLQARDTINRLAKGFSSTGKAVKEDLHLTENFPSSIEDLTENIIKQVINEVDVPPDRMNAGEKMDIVRSLNNRGVFLLKGTVHLVAKHLASSEPTVYRYLQKVTS